MRNKDSAKAFIMHYLHDDCAPVLNFKDGKPISIRNPDIKSLDRSSRHRVAFSTRSLYTAGYYGFTIFFMSNCVKILMNAARNKSRQ